MHYSNTYNIKPMVYKHCFRYELSQMFGMLNEKLIVSPGFFRQLQQQQAELEVHQRDGITAYDLSQVIPFFKTVP